MNINEQFKEIELNLNMARFNRRLGDEDLVQYLEIINFLVGSVSTDLRVLAFLRKMPGAMLWWKLSLRIRNKIIYSLKDVLKNKVSMYIFLFVVFSTYYRDEFFAFSLVNSCLEEQNYDKMIEVLIYIYQQNLIKVRS